MGGILLGSMRVERDLGYSGREPDPFEWPTFRLPEEEGLIANLEKLPEAERDAHLRLLNASYVEDLRARLVPDVVTTRVRDRRGVTITQATLDGKTNLELDLATEPRD